MLFPKVRDLIALVVAVGRQLVNLLQILIVDLRLVVAYRVVDVVAALSNLLL